MEREHHELLLCLAYLYLTAGRERRALALALVAETLAPDEPDLLRLLAHTLVENDQPGRALEILARLERIEGPSQGLLLLRSRALHRVGRRAEARQVFRTYVDGNGIPRPDDARHPLQATA